MEEFSVLSSKEQGDAVENFDGTETDARRLDATCKCTFSGAHCKLATSKPANVSTGFSMAISCSACGED